MDRTAEICQEKFVSIDTRMPDGTSVTTCFVTLRLPSGSFWGSKRRATERKIVTRYMRSNKHNHVPCQPKFCAAISVIARPIGSDAVAAGEGTFSTCSIFPEGINRKSSTRVPSHFTA
jgi:hypothetical protein